MSLIFICGTALVVAIYGIYRQFFCKPKQAYGVYDENGDVGGGGDRVPMEEFTVPDTNLMTQLSTFISFKKGRDSVSEWNQ